MYVGNWLTMRSLAECRRLVWLSDDDLECGYAVNFLSLTMHAISRDQDAYPQPCIYTQVHFNVFVAVRCFRLCVSLSCLKAVMKASFHIVDFQRLCQLAGGAIFHFLRSL